MGWRRAQGWPGTAPDWIAGVAVSDRSAHARLDRWAGGRDACWAGGLEWLAGPGFCVVPVRADMDGGGMTLHDSRGCPCYPNTNHMRGRKRSIRCLSSRMSRAAFRRSAVRASTLLGLACRSGRSIVRSAHCPGWRVIRVGALFGLAHCLARALRKVGGLFGSRAAIGCAQPDAGVAGRCSLALPRARFQLPIKIAGAAGQAGYSSGPGWTVSPRNPWRGYVRGAAWRR